MNEDPAAWQSFDNAGRHFYDRGAEVGWTRKSLLVEPPAEVARWEDFGGTWEVTGVDADGGTATVELRRCDGGEVASTLTLRDPRELRWAQVQLAIGERTAQ